MNKITAILTAHSVPMQVTTTHVLALDVMTGPGNVDASTWVDVTNYTTGQLYRWLGY